MFDHLASTMTIDSDLKCLQFVINRQTAPVSILNQFVKTSQIHNYRTRSVSSDSFHVKFSRTDKMYAFFSRVGAQIWNSEYSLFD